MRARPLVRLVRRWGFTGYGSTPLHYSLHPSIELTAACRCGCRHYGGLRIVIVSRITEDRSLHCRIHANVRSTALIRAKIHSIYTFRSRFARDQIYLEEIYGGFVEMMAIIEFISMLCDAAYTDFNPYKKTAEYLYVETYTHTHNTVLFKFIYGFNYTS